MQKLKNNEARPKFTGSYKKKRVIETTIQTKRKFALLFEIYYLTRNALYRLRATEYI